MRFKKFIAVVLTLIMLTAVVSFPATASEALYLDDDTAIVMIPGLSMNSVNVYEKDGTFVSDTKLVYDLDPLVADLPLVIGSLALSSAFNMDIGLSKSIAKTVRDLLPGFDTKNHYTETVVYDKPLSEYSEDDYWCFSQYVNLSPFGDMLGQTYLYNYDDFGSVRTAADGLNDYIQDIILEKEGYSKVVLCPISLGGTVAELYLDLYPESHSIIKKIVFMVAAADGTDIIGELFTKDLTIISSPEAVKETLFSFISVPKALETVIGYLLGFVVNERNLDMLTDAILFGVNDSIATTTLWGLCPKAYYEQARAAYLMRGKDDAKRAEVDRLMQARENLSANLDDVIAKGGKVFALSGYDLPLNQFCDNDWFGSASLTSSDTIVPTYSSSFGATVADLDQTLGSGYISHNPVCTNPAHNHLSSDGVVDASTCMFPETTWFFRWVTHAAFGQNLSALRLVKSLVSENGITDVYSSVQYPQFIY